MARADHDRVRRTTGRRGAVLLTCLACTLGLAASAVGASRLVFEEKVKADGSSSVTVTTNRTAAFRLSFKAPSAGRTRVLLTLVPTASLRPGGPSESRRRGPALMTPPAPGSSRGGDARSGSTARHRVGMARAVRARDG